FYSNVFGWNIMKWEGPVDYWLVETGPQEQPGINGGLFQRSEQFSTSCNTLDVADVDVAVGRVTANGGQVVAPKMAIPGVGWLAYCLDTEGNLFGVMQADPSAA
ncbi:MAG: VOC family protein, partial [Chloroflexota bacterium]